MLRLLTLIFGVFVRSFRSRRDLLFENLALRQQLAVLARRRPQPRFSNGDRFLWITLHRFWSGWRKALILVQPDTVVGRHRETFTKIPAGEERWRSAHLAAEAWRFQPLGLVAWG